jgi:O-antigen/teichoic acid export membrane protein
MLRVNESILRWLVVLSVPVLFPMLVYPSHLIAFIYRPDYASGGLALVILAAGFALHNVLIAKASLLTALGSTKLILANSVSAAVLNIALNVALIPRYEIAGAAVATVAAYLFRDVASVVELQYLTGHITITRRVLSPVVVAVPVVGGGWIVSSYFPVSIWIVAALTAAVGIVYMLSILLFVGFTPEEVMLIRSAEERYGLPLAPIDYLVERFS